MYKVLPFLRRVLRLLYQFCYIIMIIDLVYGLFRQPVLDVKWFGLILLMLVISYFLRERCTRGIVLFLLHVGMGAAIFFIVDNLYLKIVLFLLLLHFFTDGLLYIRNGYTLKRFFDAPWPAVFLGVALTALGAYLDYNTLIKIGYITPIAIMIIFLIALYIEGLESYLYRTRYVTGAPLSQIVSINSVIVSGILCIIFVVIALGNLLHFDVALQGFIESLLKILALIIAVVMFILHFIMSVLLGANFSFMTGFSNLAPIDEDSGLIARIIEFVIISLFMAVIIYMMIRVIKWIIRLLLARQDRSYEISEDLMKDRERRIVRERIIHEDRLIGDSPSVKARRIYKRKVLSYRRFFKPKQNETTTDIKLKMNKAQLDMQIKPWEFSDQNKNDVKEESDIEEAKTMKSEVDCEKENNVLTEMYNEVRYGGLEPDREFLKKMKNNNYHLRMVE